MNTEPTRKTYARQMLAYLLLCFCLLATGTACDRRVEGNDFSLAEEAYELHEIADARMYYERFLRKNPDEPRRWYVWQQLIDIALHFRQEKQTARSYLEMMLIEFQEDVSRRQAIQTQLAEIAEALKDFDRAIMLWEALLGSDVTPAETKAQIYRKVSSAYLRRLEFSAATDGLTLCLDLPVSIDSKADCLYDLAVTQTLTDAHVKARQSFEELLMAEGVSPRHHIMATFLLADIYEQEENFARASELYESIRYSYPNPQVVAMRLANVQRKLKKK